MQAGSSSLTVFRPSGALNCTQNVQSNCAARCDGLTPAGTAGQPLVAWSKVAVSPELDEVQFENLWFVHKIRNFEFKFDFFSSILK